MRIFFLAIAFLFSISFGSQYNVNFMSMYEFGADSVILLDTNQKVLHKDIFHREAGKIVHLSVNQSLGIDTASIYLLNNFGKPRLEINPSKTGSPHYVKYEYSNQNLIHICISNDSLFSNCTKESFLEYQNGRLVQVLRTGSTTSIIEYTYNDSGDIISTKITDTVSGSSETGYTYYDYSTGIVGTYLKRDSIIGVSIYYFNNARVAKIENISNGIKLDYYQLYYSSSQSILRMARINNESPFSSPITGLFLLNGRKLSGKLDKFSSMPILDQRTVRFPAGLDHK